MEECVALRLQPARTPPARRAPGPPDGEPVPNLLGPGRASKPAHAPRCAGRITADSARYETREPLERRHEVGHLGEHGR